MVPEADQLAEAGVAQQPWAHLQRGKHRIAVILAAGLLTSLSIAPVRGQVYPAQYVSKVWQTEQGLPQNSVNVLLQDHDGYIWTGTYGGLARFDGERFKVFALADQPGIGSLGITCLYESRSGVLWAGTAGGGLARLDHGVLTTYTGRDGLPSGFIDSIRGDGEGNVWIKTSGGLARFDGVKLEPYPSHRGKAVREFYLQARDGSMWFRYGEEVLRFGADGSIATLNVGKPSVFLVHETRDGSVWIAARDLYQLVRYYKGVFSHVPLPAAGSRPLADVHPEFAVTAAEDTNGELLLFTPAGLVRTMGGRLSSAEALPLPSANGELPKVRSLLVDREGNLWVGLIATGLVRLRPAPLTAYGKDEGLSDSSFNAVFQDREGRIWLGGNLLYWFDGHRFHLIPGVADTTAIAQTRDGDLWFGGYGQMYRWRSGVLTRFQVEAFHVSGMYEDREGILWIGGAEGDRPGGLYRFREGKLDQFPGISGAQNMTDDRNGGFWVMATQGLFHMRGGRITPYDENQGPPRRAVDFYQDSTGTLWFAANDGELSRLRDGRLKAITFKKGQSNSVLLRLLDDGRDSLWISSHQSIFRLSLKELNDFADGRLSSILPVSYGVAEGMRSSDCNWGNPGIWKTTDGRIWIPTVRGVVAIDPAAGNRIPPPVVLEEATAEKVKLALDGQTSAPAGNNTFDFRFTALSFSAPEKLRFKYRLEPYDKEWVDAGGGRTAHYTNMAPGRYSFHVIAANSYGIWNEQGAKLGFVLRPHFYQTSWFYAFCATGLLALLWMGHQFRLRQLQRVFNMRLEERVDERTRIARELHDTLLQSFQGLMFSFQAARNLLPGRTDEAIRTLDGAIRKGDEAVAEGRDAIQNLRLGSVERRLEDLLTATGQELQDAQDGNTHATVFRVIMEGQPRTLSPLLQDEIYRIAREVLRNAFRHACASRIEAAIHYDPHLFRLRIRDDGKGIDGTVLQGGARAGHWGLPGMRERAKRIGARLVLWSESGAGTEVELTVPASVAYAEPHVRRRFGLFRIATKS
jgi:signal transduction histidine kinase/ligand-binding sensor domain-containing protein